MQAVCICNEGGGLDWQFQANGMVWEEVWVWFVFVRAVWYWGGWWYSNGVEMSGVGYCHWQGMAVFSGWCSMLDGWRKEWQCWMENAICMGEWMSTGWWIMDLGCLQWDVRWDRECMVTVLWWNVGEWMSLSVYVSVCWWCYEAMKAVGMLTVCRCFDWRWWFEKEVYE